MTDETQANKTKTYPVYCAWCLSKGKKTIVGYGEIEASHSICDKCLNEILAAVYREKAKKEANDHTRS